MNVHRQLQQQLARGQRPTRDLMDDAPLLATLVGWIVRDTRRQRATRAALVAVLLGGAAAIVVTVNAPTAYRDIAANALLLALAAVLVSLRPRALRFDAIQAIRATLLPNATPEMVPDLLRLADALGDGVLIRTADFFSPAEREVHTALLRLLPRFTAPDALDRTHRKALRKLAVWRQRTEPELAVAALLALAETGDRSLARHARRWSRSHPDERLREAAAEYLRLVEKAP